MPVDALLASLERDAEAEASRRRREAQQRAEQIIGAAAASVERQRAARLERLALTRKAEVARQAAETARALKGRVLRARADLLDRIFADAGQRLARLDPARWVERIPCLVEETLCYLEAGRVVLVCRPEAEAAVRNAVGQRPVELEVGMGAAPGVLGRTRDGTVVVNNTLAARLERLRPDLAIRLLARLEGRAHALG